MQNTTDAVMEPNLAVVKMENPDTPPSNDNSREDELLLPDPLPIKVKDEKDKEFFKSERKESVDDDDPSLPVSEIDEDDDDIEDDEDDGSDLEEGEITSELSPVNVKNSSEIPSASETEPFEFQTKAVSGTDLLPFACHICGVIFAKEKQLNAHINGHKVQKLFACEVCGRGFRAKEYLMKHMRANHAPSKEFQCEMCNDSFSTASRLNEHTRRKHATERPFACEHCEKTFVTSNALLRHTSTHTTERPFQCSVCSKSFSHAHYLKGHIDRIHKQQKSKECEVCGKTFMSKKELMIHLRVHTGERPYYCTECGHYFSQLGHLKDHVKRVHVAVKNKECEICGKKFFSKRELISHVRVHTGEKPFKCPDCDKCFHRAYNQKAHYNRVHQRQRKYGCEFCDRKFFLRKELLNHMETHKMRDRYECECGMTFSSVKNMQKHCKSCDKTKENKKICLEN